MHAEFDIFCIIYSFLLHLATQSEQYQIWNRLCVAFIWPNRSSIYCKYKLQHNHISVTTSHELWYGNAERKRRSKCMTGSKYLSIFPNYLLFFVHDPSMLAFRFQKFPLLSSTSIPTSNFTLHPYSHSLLAVIFLYASVVFSFFAIKESPTQSSYIFYPNINNLFIIYAKHILFKMLQSFSASKSIYT